VGLLLMQLIFNVIVFENGRGTISISSYWESVIRGAFLLIVVLVQARVAKRRRR
jgi:galactofuranose transport system permease protein